MNNKVNISIYGAGKQGLLVKNLIESSREKDDYQVSSFIENKIFEKLGTKLEGVDVTSLYYACEKYAHHEIAAFVIPTSYHKADVLEMTRLLRQNNVSENDIYLTPINVLRPPPPIVSIKDILVKRQDFVQLFALNIHITDHCNLNCASCCHFSDISEEVFVSFEDFSNDVKKLRELVENVYGISILGGEPLLAEKPERYLEKARELFPFANIEFLTNGLLYRKISDTLVDVLKKNNILFSVSLYPPLFQQVDKMVSFFKERDVKFRILPMYSFFRTFTLKPVFNGLEAAQKCGSFCETLRNGRLGRCNKAMYIDKLNTHYGKNLFPADEGIDLYDPALTPTQLMRYLDKPLKLCSYCAEGYRMEYSSWKARGKNARLEDHLINGDKHLLSDIDGFLELFQK